MATLRRGSRSPRSDRGGSLIFVWFECGWLLLSLFVMFRSPGQFRPKIMILFPHPEPWPFFSKMVLFTKTHLYFIITLDSDPISPRSLRQCKIFRHLCSEACSRPLFHSSSFPHEIEPALSLTGGCSKKRICFSWTYAVMHRFFINFIEKSILFHTS